MKTSEAGFTLIEMLAVSPIIILAIGAFLYAAVAMTGEVLAARARNVLASDVHEALVMIENDIRHSDAFLASTNVSIATPQGRNDDTTAFLNADPDWGEALILSQSATTTNPAEATSLVYRKDQPSACNNPFIRQNDRQIINIVYFVKDDTLWRRVVMPSDYATTSCSAPWQQPTCSASETNAFCKGSDSELVRGVGVHDFTVTYYTNQASMAPSQTASNPNLSSDDRASALASCITTQVSINATQTASGEAVSWSGTRLATLPQP